MNFGATLLLVTLTTHLDVVRGQSAAPPPADPCAAAIGQLLNQCLKPVSISQPNFLWFVSNATSPAGQAPADANAFKKTICSNAKDVMPCIINRIKAVLNTSCAAGQQLLGRMQQYLMNYEMRCVDPCVMTLQQDFAKCFASNNISPELFISNKTAGGRFIGTSQAEADSVCAKKDAILSCLKPVHDKCVDAADVLKSVGFSLAAYEKALNFLCPRKADYLSAMACLVQPQPAVQACAMKEMAQMQKLADDAHVQSWSDDKFLEATCSVTKEKLVCDHAAWDASAQSACTPQVKAFRKELDCILIPHTCTDTQNGLYSDVCKTPNAQAAATNNNSAAASSSTANATTTTSSSVTAAAGSTAGQIGNGAGRAATAPVVNSLILMLLSVLMGGKM